ncbi:hypothetical protein CLV78_103141 [Aliiruegeria haliotis]|uniref:Probable membrane transporter protein n=1 Tax=Aliiruegeria haliotis TaxID=1280846 RepID=A0A2T0RSV0_9RHOB|nr:sulfite exporter TauE/SafE family protein [Aliiruegeria haliotis]PRY24275.1 hypothetical protein CLV78_103141 [Aliiruegeria haliotis]
MIPTFFIVSAILFLGGFVQGLTGFGLALVSVPLLSLALDVRAAVPVAGIFGWLVTFPIVWRMRAHIQWNVVAILVLGSLPGSWLGAELLRTLPASIILAAMGVVLIASSLYAFISTNALIAAAPPGLSAITGFFSGALGAAVGEPGPPVIAYTSMLPWTGDQVKSTLAAFFMLQMVGAIGSFWAKGLVTETVVSLLIQAVPGFMAGAALGMYGYTRMKDREINYHHIVHGLLLAVGAMLIVKAA